MKEVFGKQNGIPGVEASDELNPEMEAIMLNMTQEVIGENDIKEAISTLQRYKQGKSNLEDRVVQDELWYEGRHWDIIRKNSNVKGPEPSSSWLFNSLLNKHADAMDNYPEPIVLPREKSDEESAKVLSEILPCVMEYNDFEDTYSNNWWEKLKHGTAVYGVFWNTEKENGLGDIDIRPIDLLNIFWEPGITDIQKSRNLFIVDLVDNDILEEQYPQLKGKLKGQTIDVKEYVYDDTVDTSEKSAVVDWYYKRKGLGGKKVLHYVKFVGNTLLYSSENDPNYQQSGFYDHGEYPVVFDCLFPEKSTPVGFGYVAICKDPQLYIDQLSANILENAMMTTKKRYFMSDSTNINEDEFMDWQKPIVHVQGELTDTRVKEIVTNPLDNIYVTVAQMKIEEMKDTASNRDVNSGGTGSGVTAASAIAALQEAGNKASRDMIAASYRSHTKIVKLCIDLMRQFYEEDRAFRIVTPNGEYEFVTMNNQGLKDQVVGMDAMGIELYRKPVFDLKIKAQKKNPFSKMEQNETAKQLYQMGFFNPDMAQQSIVALKMMDFEGIDDVREQVMQGQTLLNMVQQLSQQLGMLQMAMGIQPQAQGQQNPMPNGDVATNKAETIAKPAMTDYGQELAKRSRPDMNNR